MARHGDRVVRWKRAKVGLPLSPPQHSIAQPWGFKQKIERENAVDEQFTCNKCGKETDTGYFYCPACHELHKQKHAKADGIESAFQKPNIEEIEKNETVKKE